MEIKGTAVKITPEFMKLNHAEQFNQWLELLPPDSRKIITEPIYATQWYPLEESIIVPTKILGELCYNSPKEGAMAVGIYSAEVALKGVYKIFLRVTSPHFILGRASSVFASYYNPSDVRVEKTTANSTEIIINKFTRQEALIVYRIAGWVARTVELTGRVKDSVDVNIFDNADGSVTFKVVAKWK